MDTIRIPSMKRKIILIDDNEDFRMALKHLLDSSDFIVYEAGNGEQALEMMHTDLPDLAIVDLDMPKMNGIEFSRRVKKDWPTFPILMVTAYSQFYSSKEVIAAGIDAFLQKPIDGDKLMSIVSQLLQIGAGARKSST
jgi:CheY-like chemotaxis protein